MKSTPLPHFLCSALLSFRLCALSCLHLKVYLQYCIYISLFLNYRVPESGSVTQTCLQHAEFLHFDEENLLTPLKVLPYTLHGLYLGSLFFVFYIHPWQVWPFGWDCRSRSHSQTVGPGFVAIFKDWDALHECPREVRALSSMAVGPAMKNSTPNAWR